MTGEIPTLITKRLILREWRDDDLDAYAAIVAEQDTMRYLGGIQSRSDAWRGLAMMLGHWTLRGFGIWAVVRKEDGALLGRVGLQYPEGWPGVEVTWMLGRHYSGHGYATEAAASSIRFWFSAHPSLSLISLIHPDNTASQKVAERLHYRKKGTESFELFGTPLEREVWEITANGSIENPDNPPQP